MDSIIIISLIFNVIFLLGLFSPGICRWIHREYLVWKSKSIADQINLVEAALEEDETRDFLENKIHFLYRDREYQELTEKRN